MKLGKLAKKRERSVLAYLKEKGPATRDTIQSDLIGKIHLVEAYHQHRPHKREVSGSLPLSDHLYALARRLKHF